MAEWGPQTGFDGQEKHSGKRSLRVSFDGSSDVAFYDVCQTVPADGGTAYELSAWMKSKDLTTDQGIRIDRRPMRQIRRYAAIVLGPEPASPVCWSVSR